MRVLQAREAIFGANTEVGTGAGGEIGGIVKVAAIWSSRIAASVAAFRSKVALILRNAIKSAIGHRLGAAPLDCIAALGNRVACVCNVAANLATAHRRFLRSCFPCLRNEVSGRLPAPVACALSLFGADAVPHYRDELGAAFGAHFRQRPLLVTWLHQCKVEVVEVQQHPRQQPRQQGLSFQRDDGRVDAAQCALSLFSRGEREFYAQPQVHARLAPLVWSMQPPDAADAAIAVIISITPSIEAQRIVIIRQFRRCVLLLRDKYYSTIRLHFVELHLNNLHTKCSQFGTVDKKFCYTLRNLKSYCDKFRVLSLLRIALYSLHLNWTLLQIGLNAMGSFLRE